MHFDPEIDNQPINRIDFANLMRRALSEDMIEPINYIYRIPDVKEEGNEYAVYELYRAGILAGSGENKVFWKESNITRAEVAAILIRMSDTASRQTFQITCEQSDSFSNVAEQKIVFDQYCEKNYAHHDIYAIYSLPKYPNRYFAAVNYWADKFPLYVHTVSLALENGIVTEYN